MAFFYAPKSGLFYCPNKGELCQNPNVLYVAQKVLGLTSKVLNYGANKSPANAIFVNKKKMSIGVIGGKALTAP